MKKIVLIASVFMAISPAFAQTEKKTTEKKVVKTEKKATPTKKETKDVSKVTATPAVEKVQLATEEIKESNMGQPIHVAQTTPTAPSAPPADVNKLFQFTNDAFDFGKIPAGKPTKYDLFIKNVSNETAELTLVQPGCGCTTPEYEQKKKFGPGETVKVILGYNGGAAGNGSPFSKSVTVTLNGNLTKVVTFKGETYAVPTESAPANGAIDKLKPAEEPKH